jgi:peptide/nickel transport system substrate-binding protein
MPASPAGAYQAHVLRYNYDSEDLFQLNPFLSTTSPVSSLSELTAAELVRFDAHGNAIPELATTVPTQANGGISRDGLTITWHLRHGLRWSDGAPLTAEDAVYTFRVASDPANNLVQRVPWEKLSALTAPDPYTIVFHFKTPYALFLADYFSTLSNSCILPKHVLGPGTAINEAAYNALPVGAGAFRYTAFHRGDDVELEANPYYWRGHPKLQRIVYKMITDDNTLYTQLQTGELDLWQLINGTLAQQVQTLPGKSIATTYGGALSGIYFNVTRPAVADPRVRDALRYATDQRTMVDKIALGNGAPQRSLVSSVNPDYLALPLVPYDLARAAALLDAAGWRAGPGGTRAKNGVPLTIDLAVPAGYPPSANTAGILSADWGQIGVGLTIHPWAMSSFFAPAEAGGPLRGGKFDAALFSQAGGVLYATARNNLTCDSIPPHGFNMTRYCNPALDALNQRYETAFDSGQRKAIAAEMQRLLDRDVPGIVIYQRRFLSAFDTRLHGFHPNPFSDWGDPLELDI